ncbi:MAG TPA: hypothetical protein VGS20_17490 [Candidatus Acidoferrales bacterium]|nr:hypothetical protein [Candidatus Acidoferrales bacterium]
MAVSERAETLYDLARAEAEHEQELSAELSGRAGLLAAVIGLALVALPEFWHQVANWSFMLVVSGLLVTGVLSLLVGAVGRKYERPALASDWLAWCELYARQCGDKGLDQAETDDVVLQALTQALYEDYASSAATGAASNDRKAFYLNLSFWLVNISIILLILGFTWAIYVRP